MTTPPPCFFVAMACSHCFPGCLMKALSRPGWWWVSAFPIVGTQDMTCSHNLEHTLRWQRAEQPKKGYFIRICKKGGGWTSDFQTTARKAILPWEIYRFPLQEISKSSTNFGFLFLWEWRSHKSNKQWCHLALEGTARSTCGSFTNTDSQVTGCVLSFSCNAMLL